MFFLQCHEDLCAGRSVHPLKIWGIHSGLYMVWLEFGCASAVPWGSLRWEKCSSSEVWGIHSGLHMVWLEFRYASPPVPWRSLWWKKCSPWNSGIENGLSYSHFIMHSTSALAIQRRMCDLELKYVHCEDKDECPPDSAQASTPSKTRFPSQVSRSHWLAVYVLICFIWNL